MKLDKMAAATIAALEDLKGRDIAVLDVRHMTALFDKLIVVSGDSTRQNKALASNVQEKLKALGAVVYGVEGAESGEWILVDLGAIIVHIMQPAIRKYYNLEELWGDTALPQRRVAGAIRS
jgi:ribosome-associated protein